MKHGRSPWDVARTFKPAATQVSNRQGFRICLPPADCKSSIKQTESAESLHYESRLVRDGFAMLVALLLLPGCSSFRTEMGRTFPAKQNEFSEGQTRVETVVKELGPPNQVSGLPDGFAFMYEHSVMGEFQFGFSVDFLFLRYIKFVKAWNRLNQECLLLTFDNQGILRSIGTGQWEESLGGGSAAQILFVVISLSDVSDFLSPADAHDWGQRLLLAPEITLNSSQSLRIGEHGLQQRIAPDYSGQHTLEMTQPKTEKEKKRIKKNYQMPVR